MSINMTKNFSFRQKSDEELLQLLRKGISEARDVLSVRMFRLKDTLTEKVCVEASRYLDPWDLNEAFFLAYLNAEKNFDENKDVKFLTYLCEIYRNQVSSFARKSISQREFYCSISLDQAISYEDMDTTYHEIIFDKIGRASCRERVLGCV